MAAPDTGKSRWAQLIEQRGTRLAEAANYFVANTCPHDQADRDDLAKIYAHPNAFTLPAGAGRNRYAVRNFEANRRIHTVVCGVRRAPIISLAGMRSGALHTLAGGKVHVQAGTVAFTDTFGSIPVACTCKDFRYHGTFSDDTPDLGSAAELPALSGCTHMLAVELHVKQKAS